MDETAVRKVPTYGADGVRTGTTHYPVFGMRQRGSRKTVLYMMQPKWVPVSEAGKPSPCPQPSDDELEPWIDLHIGDFVVIHTDGAKVRAKHVFASLLDFCLSGMPVDRVAAREEAAVGTVRHCGPPESVIQLPIIL